MKHIPPFFCIVICFPFIVSAQSTKKPQCDYVVENPKYFPDAQGYFVVTGWPDTGQQRKVNDSLRAWFMKPTEYYEPKKPSAKGYKNYKDKKGETLYQYHQQCSWGGIDSCTGIILKNKDTLDYLGTNGIKGTGAHLCGWGTFVYDTNLLCVAVEYDPQIERDTFEDPAFFHLQTGEMLFPHATLHIIPGKKDSLRALLMQRAIVAVKGYEDYKIDSLDVPDSIAVSDWQLMFYYSDSPVPFYFSFVVDGKLSGGQLWHTRLSVELTYKELQMFTQDKLEEQLDKFSEPRK